MVDRFYGYQSETSPREIQPEYRPYRNTYPEKRTSTINTKYRSDKSKQQKKVEKKAEVFKNKTLENNKEVKKSIKPRVKLLFLVAAGFSILFIVSYRNSIINESFGRKENLKSELSSIQKTNEQLQVSIENSLNLNNVEQEAKERVGMQKLSNNQKVYVNLEKKDYVESATEEIIMEEEGNFFDKVVKGFTKSI